MALLYDLVTLGSSIGGAIVGSTISDALCDVSGCGEIATTLINSVGLATGAVIGYHGSAAAMKGISDAMDKKLEQKKLERATKEVMEEGYNIYIVNTR